MTRISAFALAALLFVFPTAYFALAQKADSTQPAEDVPRKNLILDLDADRDVDVKDGKVVLWKNQADFKAKEFRATRAGGEPALQKHVDAIHGHDAVVFRKQELINADVDAFDHLITGSGYTWLAVVAAEKQLGMEPNVNSFFGNLKNGGFYEGFWAGFDDDNTLWIGSRNSSTFGRWNKDNPKLSGPKLETGRYSLVAGRMGAGTGNVTIELFVNGPRPIASASFPVNPRANSSKMAIGQERDATNHPGRESFNGEIARLVMWDRPLSDEELSHAIAAMKDRYAIK